MSEVLQKSLAVLCADEHAQGHIVVLFCKPHTTGEVNVCQKSAHTLFCFAYVYEEKWD